MYTVEFHFSVAFLMRAARITQPPERMVFLTGVSLFNKSLVFATDMIPVEFEASRVHVHPKNKSLLEMLARLRDFELPVFGQIHSHPGRFLSSTLPSWVDLNTAAAWETGGPFISLIVSEGGRYVRFVRPIDSSYRSVIKIHGKHVLTTDVDAFELPKEGYDSEMQAGDQFELVFAGDRPPEAVQVVGSERD